MKNLFIVGVGRSGTSLLQSMLATHSKVVMMPETGYIRRFIVPAIKNNCDVVPKITIESDQYVQRWIGDCCYSPVLSDDQEDSLNVFKTYVSSSTLYSKGQGKTENRYIGDKDPKMIEVLPYINEVFDYYEVVHILRDPRDILASKNKAEWSKKQTVFKKLVANVVQLKIESYFEALNPNKVINIRYEDLLREPESTLSEVCRRLEIPLEKSMLNFQDEAKRLVSKEEYSWKKETMGPLMVSNTEKWRNEITPETTDLVEKACSIAMARGGYQSSGLSVSKLRKLYNSFFSFVIKVAAEVYFLKMIKIKRHIL